LIHRGGAGVSQILGTGGRDLSEAVGAATTLRALALLAADPRTRSVAVIAKLPAPAVAARVLAAASTLGKPAVVYFQG
ncbi:MAG: FdrA family protein, partial [Gammaproteobacteria bacterium]|nr:FdrA family protein [Gammaproteobacteria bacterium]